MTLSLEAPNIRPSFSQFNFPCYKTINIHLPFLFTNNNIHTAFEDGLLLGSPLNKADIHCPPCHTDVRQGRRERDIEIPTPGEPEQGSKQGWGNAACLCCVL